MMSGCSKCQTIGGVLLLLAGIGFLLADLKQWAFWGLNWWSVFFVLMGLGAVGKSQCKDCKKA